MENNLQYQHEIAELENEPSRQTTQSGEIVPASSSRQKSGEQYKVIDLIPVSYSKYTFISVP